MYNNQIVIDIASTANARPSSRHDEPSWSMPLYNAIKKHDWDRIKEILDREPEAITSRLGSGEDIPLVVAIEERCSIHIIENLIERTPPEKLAYSFEETSAFERSDSAIHLAALTGNYSAVKLLIAKNPAMVDALNYEKHTPVQVALYCEQTEMAYYLLKLASTYVQDEESQLTNTLNKDLFEYAVTKRMYDLAFTLIWHYPKLAYDTATWKKLIEDCDDFPCRKRLNMLQSIIYFRISISFTTIWESLNHERQKANIRFFSNNSEIQSPRPQISQGLTELQSPTRKILEMLVPGIKNIRVMKLKHSQALQLVTLMCPKVNKDDDHDNNNLNRVFNSAVQNGVSDIVEVILQVSRDAISYIDDDGNNAFRYAASHRDGKTFNVLYKALIRNSGNTTTYLDNNRNNILHLVAKKPQRNRLGTSSGQVLQLQREFQWYKTIERLLPSSLQTEKNLDKKVPLEVFDEEHKEMLKSESEWMTSMSNSCMVGGSLIAAVVFAAAITLPGGNNDNGVPNFSKDFAFKVFAFSDAFALVSSLTVVVTFLSIFTTRYSVESFQFDLPNRLIIGLISLLLSVTFMMIAFSATIHLLFAKDYDWIIYPTVAVSFVPVFFFGYFQVPSLLNIIKSTYFHHIFEEDNITKSKDK